MLENDCIKSLELIKGIRTSGNNSLMFEVADVKVWANLGLLFSERLQGAVALHTYRLTGRTEEKQKAILHLGNALSFLDTVIAITRPIYNRMPLVHLSEQDGKPWKENDWLRFHWELLRPDAAKDVEIAKNATMQ
jgi:hypothetical protein